MNIGWLKGRVVFILGCIWLSILTGVAYFGNVQFLYTEIIEKYEQVNGTAELGIFALIFTIGLLILLALMD